ncbi:hypothetical protein [Microtetraspora glauca]|uniref:Uncharacterized protein n=1 Tax=Microtetraspora glauca TaxID=1996 RepID=A0ABV3GA23_MICGL
MRRRLPHAELLEKRVQLPGGAYPDSYTARPDPTDELLAAMHDELWPREEWTDVEDCPRLDLFPYETYSVARGALRRHRREGGLFRHVFYRVHECPCSAYHVGPWFLGARP